MICPACAGFAAGPSAACPACGASLASPSPDDALWQEIAPLRFLARQRSNAGVVARRDLLGWRIPDDEEIVPALRRGLLVTQLQGGSWNASLGWTAWRAYQLAELGLTPDDEPLRRALDWIYERRERAGDFHERVEVVNSYPTVIGDEMAFAKKGMEMTMYVLGHVLPLGLEDAAPLAPAREYVLQTYKGGKWCCTRCTAALLVALVHFPEAEARSHAHAARAWLQSAQMGDGGWRGASGSLFYYVLHAVGLYAEGRPQVEAALPRLRRMLQRDGAWGLACRAEKTAVAIHTLARHGLLTAFRPCAV